MGLSLSHEFLNPPSKRQWPCLNKRQGSHLRIVMLKSVSPVLFSHAFVETSLLKPKASDRAIQHPKKTHVLICARARRELNNGRTLLEYCPSIFDHKV